MKRVRVKELSARYKGMAFVHYVSHCLTLRGVTSTIPLPDTGDDAWIDVGGTIVRAQMKSAYSFTGASRYKYTMHVSERFLDASKSVSLIAGLYLSYEYDHPGCYLIGFLSGALLRTLVTRKVLVPSFKAGRQKHYNVYFTVRFSRVAPHYRIVLKGSAAPSACEVTSRFGAKGELPRLELLREGLGKDTAIRRKDEMAEVLRGA